MLGRDLIQRLISVGHAGRTEADIQSDIKVLLLSGDFGLDEPRLEVQVEDGTRRRIDIQVGATVIEVKKNLDQTGVLAKAAEQLSGYVHTKTLAEQSRYNGILTDGRRWLLYEEDPATGDFIQQAQYLLTTVDSAGTLTEWLQSVLATHSSIRPRAAAIEATLGASSPAYAQDHTYLAGLYARLVGDKTVQLKRELWARLLRSALGTGFTDDSPLFVDHTLLVIEATAIGHAIMGVPVEDLIADPEAMLNGVAFREHDIQNVVEADFFDWLLADPDGPRFVSRIIQRVAVFDWSNTQHDVLKVLYESVINASTRKALGEYYTPDWLAEGIVAKCVTDPLNMKVLDPACGSGTFVYHGVRRFLAAAEAAGWDNERTIAEVQGHVFGLDIHPVSVTLARITYLLALGDRLLRERGPIQVPIHLGDSVQWAQDDAATDVERIKIRVDGSDLTALQATLLDVAETLVFPLANIDDPGTFDRLVRDLAALAHEHTDPARKHPSALPILRRYGIADGDDAATLTATFRMLCDLNAQGRDSIWGYFVRNQVRPLWLSMPGSRVDVLVGNPPWVAYRHMTADMQEQFRSFSERRNLWHGKKVATHQDLVGLFIVRAIEQYLNDGGQFGFVTPLATLSRQQYEGFRAGQWGASTAGSLRGELTELWDLDGVTPRGFFPVPAGVVFGVRHTRGVGVDSVDVPYGSPQDKQVVTGPRNKDGWAATVKQLTFTTKPNTALSSEVSTGLSPYAASVTQGATIVPRYLCFVREELSTSRLGQAAGKVRVRSKRSRLEKDPWKSRPDLVATVEKRFVHQVHLGATIAPFRPLPCEIAVLPIEAGKVLTAREIATYPGLKNWWDRANEEWEACKTGASKLDLRGRLNFQHGLSRQLDGVKHRVIYSKSGNKLVAARSTDPTQIIDHSLYWIPATSLDEARYLTAVLNAPATTLAVSEYQSRGLFGARHFDKYVWRLRIPTYDSANDAHLLLATLAASAEHEASLVDLAEVSGFQSARIQIRTALDVSGIHAQLDALVTELLGIDDVVPAEPDPLVTRKAAAIRDGNTLLRTSPDSVLFDELEVEVDLDCEYDESGVYLWGATLTTPDAVSYHHFGGPDADERVAAQGLADWLTDVLANADEAGQTACVFHYGHVEASHLDRILGSKASSLLDRFRDMIPILRANYFAPQGFGLKTVAAGAGARWRSPGASGKDTVGWVQLARSGDGQAWNRILEYNEDDTRATRTLRRALAIEAALVR